MFGGHSWCIVWYLIYLSIQNPQPSRIVRSDLELPISACFFTTSISSALHWGGGPVYATNLRTWGVRQRHGFFPLRVQGITKIPWKAKLEEREDSRFLFLFRWSWIFPIFSLRVFFWDFSTQISGWGCWESSICRIWNCRVSHPQFPPQIARWIWWKS